MLNVSRRVAHRPAAIHPFASSSWTSRTLCLLVHIRWAFRTFFSLSLYLSISLSSVRRFPSTFIFSSGTRITQVFWPWEPKLKRANISNSKFSFFVSLPLSSCDTRFAFHELDTPKKGLQISAPKYRNKKREGKANRILNFIHTSCIIFTNKSHQVYIDRNLVAFHVLFKSSADPDEKKRDSYIKACAYKPIRVRIVSGITYVNS